MMLVKLKHPYQTTWLCGVALLAAACGGEDGDDGAGASTAGTGGTTSTATAGPRITFDPPSGTFSGSVSVALGGAEAGSEIRYTLDGTLPNANSSLYDGTAVQLTQTTQLRAEAFTGGQAAGLGATGLYVARSADISSDLGLIVMDSYGSGELDENDRDYLDAAFMTFGVNGATASVTAPATIATRSGFHVRGQSSATFDKKPYRVEFWGEDNLDIDLPVLGMPAESDWALIGPREDETLIRHAFVYDLARDMGMQAPRYAFAELYLNVDGGTLGMEDYRGVYMFVETIKNAKNRTDLKQLHEGDTAPELLSGGYIFKIEYAAAEEPTLQCTGNAGTCWTDLEVHDPVPLDPAQGAWLQNYIQQFHDALHGSNISDPTTGYPAYIDTASFVDQFIINEFSKDVDAYIRSQYFYKDRDAPIFAGPVWDYNLSLGAGFDFGGINNLTTDGWMYPQRTDGVSDWFPILAEDPEFSAKVRARWAELRTGLLSEAQLNARVDTIAAPLAASAARNFELWGQPGGDGGGSTSGGPGGGGVQDIFTGPDAPTWEGQLQAMKEWMAGRLAWLDSQWM